MGADEKPGIFLFGLSLRSLRAVRFHGDTTGISIPQLALSSFTSLVKTKLKPSFDPVLGKVRGRSCFRR